MLLVRWCGLARTPWPLAGCLGAAAIIATGGVLNLAQWIRPPVLVSAVVLGVVLFGVLRRRERRTIKTVLAPLRQPVSVTLTILFVILTAVPVLGNIQADVRTFNFYDDLPAYLTLPMETLQLGSLPSDPFNERRVTSCLGAPYVLQSFMTMFGGVQSIRFIDVSIGMILYAGALFAIFRALGLSLNIGLALLLLVFVAPIDRWNATAQILPAALFCSLFLLQIEGGVDDLLDWRRALLLALMTAALCALKSNYLPAAVLIGVFYYAGRCLVLRKTKPLLEALAWGACTAVFLFPWMLDMHRKEGTYLFPILGRGYDASAYGIIPLPNGSRSAVSSAALWVWITVLPMAGPLLIAFAASMAVYWKRIEREWIAPLCALLLGSALAIFSIASSTGGESMGRYSLPFQLPALFVFLAFVIRWSNAGRLLPWWVKAAAACVVCAIVVSAFVFGYRHGQYKKFLEDARLLTPPGQSWFAPEVETRRMEALQAKAPPGDRILARLLVTYSFDFRRNPIFIADYTGMASLPRGMPLTQGPEALRTYLLKNEIRYVAFDPGRTSLPDDDPATSLQQVLKDRQKYGRHGWLYVQTKVANSEQKLIAELGCSYRHVFDDGVVYLLDLEDRVK